MNGYKWDRRADLIDFFIYNLTSITSSLDKWFPSSGECHEMLG
jgi:hypothetical protein